MSANSKGLPTVKRVRAYFAPVDRVAQQATLFDAAQQGMFALEAPPAPWVDLGWVTSLKRTSTTEVVAVQAGAPAATRTQVRKEIGAELQFVFERWGKLQMLLSAGTQQMNLLAVQAGAALSGSGGVGVAAVAMLPGATATTLPVGAAAAGTFAVGQMVAVDVDYAPGTVGFLGSGVSGTYVQNGVADVDYVRRITLNVSRIASITDGVLTLERALLAGVPTTAMKVSALVGVCDREGSRFFQEWSALLVAEGQQGERIIWHYPRLQSAAGIEDDLRKSAGGYNALHAEAKFRALPISDALDGERVVCFRSFVGF